MTLPSMFAGATIHHVALKVADADACKEWFLSMLGFEVERTFSFNGTEITWLCPAGSKGPIIEIFGGAIEVMSHETPMDGIRKPGFQHICLQVDNLDDVMTELRRRRANIIFEVMDGAPGSGVAKGAFIADPWNNIIEILEVAPSSGVR